MTTTLRFPTVEASTADSAKLLKQTLSRAFPAARFSVRLSRGTGYGNCHISWTDGPTVRLVDQVAAQFEGASFDGMTDSMNYRRVLMPDGREPGLNLILTERRTSPALARRAAAQVAAFYGLELPTITETAGGYWQVENDNRWVRDDIREYWSTLIHRAASDASAFRRDA